MAAWKPPRLRDLRRRPPFDEESRQIELRNRLGEIPGLTLSDPEPETGFQYFSLATLKAEESLKQFLVILEWVLGAIQPHQPSPG